MFTKPELQLILQTLQQRRDWLQASLAKPDANKHKSQGEAMLTLLESAMAKTNDALRHESRDDAVVNHYISNKVTSPLRQAATVRRQQLSADRIRVLMVDDDDLICELLSTYLRDLGITQIHMAKDGHEAISSLYDADPVYDLVLCDWNMPIKSGLDVHNAMRAAERYHATIFMLVTGVTEAKQIKAAIEGGVNDYVVKPIEPEKLRRKIARFFPVLNKN